MKKKQPIALLTIMGLSLTLSPFLITILLLRAWESYLVEIGKFSEEIFRAEQLPLLSFSEHSSIERNAIK